MPRSVRLAALAASIACLACGLAAPAIAAPIPDNGPAPSLPAWQGRAAKPKPVKDKTRPPQNRHLAQNPWSNIHNDTWMTDAYLGKGPLGRSPNADSRAHPGALCGSLTFDSKGRILTVCPSLSIPPQARIIDPESLETIATYDLPGAADPKGTVPYQNFSGGGYFYLDGRDRMWIPTRTDHIVVLGESDDGRSLVKKRDFDLTSVLNPKTERITSALPDFSGLIWFVTKQHGKVGTLDPKSGRIRVTRIGENIENSFAVAKGGAYIASSRHMFRFVAARNGAPRIAWKAGYETTGVAKPGQVDDGTGTTPTIVNGGYVAITDNADPMNVVVYRRANRLERHQRRKVCEVPVFKKGKGATENTLLTSGRKLVVENNYGYTSPFAPGGPGLTEPGFARVDVNKNGKGCHRVWTKYQAYGASVVPKISQKTGLIYTYTRPPDPSGSVGYYWTALDLASGKTVWRLYAGSGLGFNNNYAGIAIGPGGTAYLGVIGGMVRLRDGG